MDNKLILTMMVVLLVFCMKNTASGFEQEDIAMHGFVSQGYLKSSDNNYLGNSKDGSYEFNEIGINFSAPITDELRFGIQLFSRDLGDFGNNELDVKLSVYNILDSKNVFMYYYDYDEEPPVKEPFYMLPRIPSIEFIYKF